MWEKGADDEVFSRKAKPKTAAKCVLFLVFGGSFVFVLFAFVVLLVVVAEKHSKRRPSMWFLLFSFVCE